MPKKKTNTAFLKMAQAPLKPSPQLAEILGSPAPISRHRSRRRCGRGPTSKSINCKTQTSGGRSWPMIS